MLLSPGARLGPYEIVEPLGAGGMGEVYKARDPRLDRFVALKVLRDAFQHDPAGRERFEREARAIAALEHPHICVLHDVGQHPSTGSGQAVDYLVMEYLEGETLATRLAARPKGLPLKEAIDVGIQIASALDAAHRRGIVHRDVKPANVMLTKGGVKLLDFGLAKASGGSMAVTQAPLTAPATLLGTLQYMAPEQIEGKEADARSDLFAFGCVLYEMLSGCRAFDGKSRAIVIAAILDHEPPALTELQSRVPAGLERLVRTCLAKDPDQRWQSAADLKRELAWLAESRPARPAPGRRTITTLGATAAVLGLVITGAIAGRWTSGSQGTEAAIVLSVVPPPGTVFGSDDSVGIALSPDGQTLAFTASKPGAERLLYVRPLGSADARPLAGTEGAHHPFWSPDSTTIAFFGRGKLKKVPATGGEPQALCDTGQVSGGGTWSPNGTIVFSPFFEGALYRVSASGGTPVSLTRLDPAKGETHHFWPRFLPDGRRFLFQIYARDGAGEYVGGLDSDQRQQVLDAPRDVAGFMGYVADYAPGHLVFLRGTTLMAQPFDQERQVLTGEPIRLAENIARMPGGFSAFAASSAANILAYRRAEARTPTRLTWFDRTGRAIGWAGPEAAYEGPSLSGDDRTIAVQRWETPERRSLWIIDAARGTQTRLTTNPDDMAPVWSPDGRRVVYASARDTPPNLFVRTVTGTAEAEDRLFTSRFFAAPSSWTRDGRSIVYQTFNSDTGYDISTFDLAGRKSIPLIKTPFNELDGRVSPDNRWIAYTSDESGRNEIYVRPFTGSGARVQISVEGGEYAAWNETGRELLYVEGARKLMSVALDLHRGMPPGRPAMLFEVRFGPSHPYVLSADGQRVLVNVVAGDVESSPITVVLNWPALGAR